MTLCIHAVSGVYCPGVWHRLVASVVLEHQPYPDWHQWAAGLVPELELDHKEAGTSWSQLAGAGAVLMYVCNSHNNNATGYTTTQFFSIGN